MAKSVVTKIKDFLHVNPVAHLILIHSFVVSVLMIIMSFMIPLLLNYPPESINTAFDIKMSYISYTVQLTFAAILVILLTSVFLKISLNDISKWYKGKTTKKILELSSIRRKCFHLPYTIFWVQIFISILTTIIVLILTGSHSFAMVFKIILLISSFSTIYALLALIFSKNIYLTILADTSTVDKIDEGRMPLVQKIFIQIFPVFLVAIIITLLLGYSRFVKEKSDLMFNCYSTALSQTFTSSENLSKDDVIKKLDNIKLYGTKDSQFMISPNGDQYNLRNGAVLSTFFIKYTQQIAEKYNGRTYDSYGVDVHGAVKYITCNNERWIVGVEYELVSNSTLLLYLFEFLILSTIIIIVLYYFSLSLSSDISNIANKLNIITQSKEIGHGNRIPITSNDEIGDLIIGFNKIQALTKDHIEEIDNNHEIIMEKERLASLGQMIGGIAHNLKTPIMSIAGAMKDFEGLISEYENSISDKEVTVQDHLAIAEDMSVWVEKVKSHCEYMSDVISTVRDQAVQYNTATVAEFTINEFLKKLSILAKFNLNKFNCQLQQSLHVDGKTTLTGDLNSLIQVFDNLIVNAIYAYGTTGGKIVLSIFDDVDNLRFTVQDTAGGLPEIVKDRLFKEMITTKGKDGTGLGIYMSHSTIKGKFNGNMTFDSIDGKGTTFIITIPKNSNME